jgi:hypothetical protein
VDESVDRRAQERPDCTARDRFRYALIGRLRVALAITLLILAFTLGEATSAAASGVGPFHYLSAAEAESDAATTGSGAFRGFAHGTSLGDAQNTLRNRLDEASAHCGSRGGLFGETGVLHVNGDPVNLTDPDGHIACDTDFNGQSYCNGVGAHFAHALAATDLGEEKVFVRNVVRAAITQAAFGSSVRCQYELGPTSGSLMLDPRVEQAGSTRTSAPTATGSVPASSPSSTSKNPSAPHSPTPLSAACSTMLAAASPTVTPKAASTSPSTLPCSSPASTCLT